MYAGGGMELLSIQSAGECRTHKKCIITNESINQSNTRSGLLMKYFFF